MTWISINPNSESRPAVEAAAYIVGVDPENISPAELADAYNRVADSQGSKPSAELEGNINGFIE